MEVINLRKEPNLVSYFSRYIQDLEYIINRTDKKVLVKVDEDFNYQGSEITDAVTWDFAQGKEKQQRRKEKPIQVVVQPISAAPPNISKSTGKEKINYANHPLGQKVKENLERGRTMWETCRILKVSITTVYTIKKAMQL